MRRRLLAGQPPTVREVQQALGFRAVETARAHLEALVHDGLLVKRAGKARGYQLADGPTGPPPQMVPVLGRVQAGALTTALQEPQGFVPVQTRMPGGDLFALRVRGDSMVGAGILPNDVVVVRRQPSADSGDLVVALVGDEATVKHLHLGQPIELRAANPAYPPIRVADDELTVLGKVVEVRRYLDEELPPTRVERSDA